MQKYTLASFPSSPQSREVDLIGPIARPRMRSKMTQAEFEIFVGGRNSSANSVQRACRIAWQIEAMNGLPSNMKTLKASMLFLAYRLSPTCQVIFIPRAKSQIAHCQLPNSRSRTQNHGSRTEATAHRHPAIRHLLADRIRCPSGQSIDGGYAWATTRSS